MANVFRKYCLLVLLLSALTASATAGAQTVAKQDLPRFVIYFDEFSANLSNEAKNIIADAVKQVRASGAKTIVVQARASATGTPDTNKYLAQTRTSIVSDQLQADGAARAMIRQEPIGQTGSDDPSVYNRRVDIILER
jgi:outer membrane protein OmpA-like peptidoglycan-associated protein